MSLFDSLDLETRSSVNSELVLCDENARKKKSKLTLNFHFDSEHDKVKNFSINMLFLIVSFNKHG